jgi:hypothetical protein
MGSLSSGKSIFESGMSDKDENSQITEHQKCEVFANI